MRISTLLVFLLFVWLPVGAATAYTVTLNGFNNSSMTAYADDASGFRASETVNPVALSYSYTSNNVDGLVSSEAQYSLTDFGFNITLSQARSSTFQTIARSHGTIFFSVNEDVDFVASGSYTAVDATGSRILLLSRLFDITQSTYLYQSKQTSDVTANESFTLGLAEGDQANFNFGSLSGTLLAGNDYRFNFDAYIQSFPSEGSSATATGNFALTFIPEPGTGLLVTMGLVAMTAGRKRSN